MITIVKFDIIEPIREIGPNFPVYTASEPWNDEFDTLGYGSKNLFDCLGSFNVFIGWMEVELVLYMLNRRRFLKCSKRLMKRFRSTVVFAGFLTLFV